MKIIFDYNRTIFNPDKQEIYSGVPELLNDLHEKNELFLVSKNEPGRKEILEKFGIVNFFKKIVFTDNKSTKLFEELVGPGGEVMVVGDRVRGEISIGNELNYITIWIKQGKFMNENPTNKKEEPKHTIANISELKEIIKQYEQK